MSDAVKASGRRRLRADRGRFGGWHAAFLEPRVEHLDGRSMVVLSAVGLGPEYEFWMEMSAWLELVRRSERAVNRTTRELQASGPRPNSPEDLGYGSPH